MRKPTASGVQQNGSLLQLLRMRNFRLLWGAGGLSAIGDQFDLIAFPWLVLLITGDPLAVGAVIAVGGIPTVVFMLLGGSLSLLMISAVGLTPLSHTVSGALLKLSLEWVFVGAGALLALLCLTVIFRREIRSMRMLDGASSLSDQ